VSLYRGYPPEACCSGRRIRRGNQERCGSDRQDRHHLGDLDGQQRLTTLYLLTRGEIPPYYNKADIKNDPRDLYFDVDSGDFQYFQHILMARTRHGCQLRLL